MQNIALYAISVLIWGSTWYVIKFQLGVVDPLLSLSYRFLLAAVVIAAWITVTRQFKSLSFSRRGHIYIALQGFLLFFLNYWLFYIATQHLTSGLVAVCFSTLPLMNAFNQFLFFKISLRRQVLAGSLLGLAGIALIFWPELRNLHAHDPRILSFVMCLAATYAASLGNIASLRNSRHNMPIIPTNGLAMLYGAGFSFLVALASGTAINFDMSFSYTASLVYLAIFGSAIAFISYLTLIARIGADRAAYTAVLFPIVALVISTAFESYAWSWEALIGIALIIAGNVLALSKRRVIA